MEGSLSLQRKSVIDDKWAVIYTNTRQKVSLAKIPCVG